MNSIKCKIKGCKEVFQTEEVVSPSARFICKNHPRSMQLAVIGREMVEKDTKDADVYFQEHSHDKDIKRL